jgi:hypothetical protein
MEQVYGGDVWSGDDDNYLKLEPGLLFHKEIFIFR